jgi:alanyl-tRNA synthetase
MTERLYYTNAYLKEFDATVLDVVSDADGRSAAILDRTAFYPTSGGQPFDTGALGDSRVVDVVDRDDGAVLHIVEGKVLAGPTYGRIDWDRRFEHMQQHTGQHVLSAAFERTCQARTSSFHLGTSSATIDLAQEVLPAQIAAAELVANRVVWEDRPVSVRFVDESEAANLPLRKEPRRSGRLRIVEVDGFDLSACGGTHVSRTGAIGNISVGSFERFRGGMRVEFRCGIRALESYRLLRDTVSAAARLLSTGLEDLPAATERLQSENNEGRRRIKHLQEKLAGHEASVLAERPANRVASTVIEALDGWDASGLKAVASALVERAGYAAILASTSAPVSIVVARAPDRSIDAAAIVKALTTKFGGKGGGRPELAQGGGLTAAGADVVLFARTLLEERKKEEG